MSEREKEDIPVPAAWEPDCQGKWDYDGNLVTLSTRYWPRGGGYMMTMSQGGTVTIKENDNLNICPSATAKIYLGSTSDAYYDNAQALCSADFTGDTEALVKAQVVAWATIQFERIQALLRREFGK